MPYYMVYGKCLLSDWEGSRQPNVKRPESKPKIRGKGELRTSIMQQHTIDLFTSTILGVLVSSCYEQNVLFLNFSSSSFENLNLKSPFPFPNLLPFPAVSFIMLITRGSDIQKIALNFHQKILLIPHFARPRCLEHTPGNVDKDRRSNFAQRLPIFRLVTMLDSIHILGIVQAPPWTRTCIRHFPRYKNGILLPPISGQA